MNEPLLRLAQFHFVPFAEGGVGLFFFSVFPFCRLSFVSAMDAQGVSPWSGRGTSASQRAVLTTRAMESTAAYTAATHAMAIPPAVGRFGDVVVDTRSPFTIRHASSSRQPQHLIPPPHQMTSLSAPSASPGSALPALPSPATASGGGCIVHAVDLFSSPQTQRTPTASSSAVGSVTTGSGSVVWDLETLRASELTLAETDDVYMTLIRSQHQPHAASNATADNVLGRGTHPPSGGAPAASPPLWSRPGDAAPRLFGDGDGGLDRGGTGGGLPDLPRIASTPHHHAGATDSRRTNKPTRDQQVPVPGTSSGGWSRTVPSSTHGRGVGRMPPALAVVPPTSPARWMSPDDPLYHVVVPPSVTRIVESLRSRLSPSHAHHHHQNQSATARNQWSRGGPKVVVVTSSLLRTSDDRRRDNGNKGTSTPAALFAVEHHSSGGPQRATTFVSGGNAAPSHRRGSVAEWAALLSNDPVTHYAAEGSNPLDERSVRSDRNSPVSNLVVATANNPATLPSARRRMSNVVTSTLLDALDGMGLPQNNDDDAEGSSPSTLTNSCGRRRSSANTIADPSSLASASSNATRPRGANRRRSDASPSSPPKELILPLATPLQPPIAVAPSHSGGIVAAAPPPAGADGDESFHRSLLAWYRTENALLRDAS